MSFDREIYVNLPVANLDRSMAFFRRLGFEFNARFTNEKCACLVIGENSFVMLLPDPVFEEFIPGKSISDTNTSAEALVAVSVPDREAVDDMVRQAVEAGGSAYREPADFGWVYYRAFQDLDRHIWEVMATDESLAPGGEPDEPDEFKEGDQ
ncbi:MAG: glyoxalase/bleomycin resistance/extradiol dioxygenase family protein [Chloroflexi bacterium]|nr:glyoxalase/bleomycin resistance/extradiol dioxygenase family protein [Chloroflexota bacterium]